MRNILKDKEKNIEAPSESRPICRKMTPLMCPSHAAQMSFSDADYAGKCKQTRRERFLAEMERFVPVSRPRDANLFFLKISWL